MIRRRGRSLQPLAVLALALLGAPGAARADALVLAVHVGDPPLGTATARSLARFLGERTGVAIRARVAPSALSHWRALAAGARDDLAFEDAHFAAYRISRQGFVAVARLSAERVVALATAPGVLVTGLDALVGRSLATPPAPGLAGVLAHAMFPERLRAPRFVTVADFAAGARALRDGTVDAAMLPRDSPLARGLNVVAESAPVPGAVLSTSPGLASALRAGIARALLAAGASAEGRRLLAALGAQRFERADAPSLGGLDALLAEEWGYRPPPPANMSRAPGS